MTVLLFPNMLIKESKKLAKKINVRRFVRYEMGEGLEKRKDDFACEVMNATKK